MRTTLTLDDDVAAALERLRRKRDASLKELVNEALRRGIRDLTAPPPRPRKPYRTRTVDLGKPRVPLDNVKDILEMLDEEDFRKNPAGT